MEIRRTFDSGDEVKFTAYIGSDNAERFTLETNPENPHSDVIQLTRDEMFILASMMDCIVLKSKRSRPDASEKGA